MDSFLASPVIWPYHIKTCLTLIRVIAISTGHLISSLYSKRSVSSGGFQWSKDILINSIVVLKQELSIITSYLDDLKIWVDIDSTTEGSMIKVVVPIL